jgi:hypothetical protein
VIPISRDWLTLAFGVGLVTVVVGLSVRHNVQWRAAAPAEPQADAATTAAAAGPEAAPPVVPAVDTKPAAPPQPAGAAPAETRKARFDVSVPVVHKHRFGSCGGTLRATENGLAFGASNRDDTFQLSFSDIDRFEIAGSTLSVRRRGGRTWNFNGQGDRADALVAFHRAVERARR